jgi:asparagine synthase (glutamine-hydrolysing)
MQRFIDVHATKWKRLRRVVCNPISDMCGIAGKFVYDASASIDRRLLQSMTDAVVHRGPDADGYYLGPGIALGHRRLRIIDLVTGDQPLANEDGSVRVIFNGEIYNFEELRRALEARGHAFRTRSDTEVIVHGYEEWGDRAVERFRGMFAFALWDERRRRLLLARDRAGVKPLHYAELPDGIVFGSEIKSLIEDPDVPRDWSAEAIDAFLTLLYIPAPRTVFDAIRKLPAAHYLVAERGSVTLHRYWDLEFGGNAGRQALGTITEEQELHDIDEALREAVRLRLISDVPLGAFLSGGIDSSAVVRYMVETSDAPVVTTSVGFGQATFDELAYAESVARYLGCEFHPQIANPQIEQLLPKLAWHFDEPFADSSAVPTYYVSAAARSLVTVALSGDGGDELWAGYARHRVEQWRGRACKVLGRAAPLAAFVARALPLSVKGARALRHLALRPDKWYALQHAYGLFEPEAKPALYSDGFTAAARQADPFAPFRDAWQSCRSADPVDRAMYVDFRTYLPDDIMTKVDRMSMAVSLEAREPLLDHLLLERTAAVPSALKLKNGTTKYLLRRLLERRVPQAILERKKHGFDAPIGAWLHGPLAEMTADLLTDGRLRARGLFRQAEVDRLWKEHRSGRGDHAHRLWQLLMLELWFRQFVDRYAAAPRTAAPRPPLAQAI